MLSRNISIVENEVSCLLSTGTNINITDGVVSSTGGGTTKDATTDLAVKSLTSVGNITAGGIITSPNQIVFVAFSRSSASVSGTNTQKLLFNEVKYNIGGHYNPSTYIFTCPVAGRYLYVVNYFNIGSQGATRDIMRKFGTTKLTILRNQGRASPSNNEQRSVQIITECNVGDVIYDLMRLGALRLAPFDYIDDNKYGPFSIPLLS
jgi:hypothetical protein